MKKEDITIGLNVIYWTIITEDNRKLGKLKTTITSNVWTNKEGDNVFMVKHKTNPVKIANLEKLNE